MIVLQLSTLTPLVKSFVLSTETSEPAVLIVTRGEERGR